MSSLFKIGDLVWAKQKYSPYWPAQVIEAPSENIRKDSYYVFFFGTKNSGWVKKDNVVAYISLGADTKRKNKLYTEGVKKIAQIYHEEFQLNSPLFKRMKFADDEALGVEQNEKSPDAQVPCKSEESDYEDPIPASSTYNLPKKGKKRRRPRQKRTIRTKKSSSTSSFATVKVHDFKKIITRELRVHITRCDEALRTSGATKISPLPTTSKGVLDDKVSKYPQCSTFPEEIIISDDDDSRDMSPRTSGANNISPLFKPSKEVLDDKDSKYSSCVYVPLRTSCVPTNSQRPASLNEVIVLDDEDSISSSSCDMPPDSATKMPTTASKEVLDGKNSELSNYFKVVPRTTTVPKSTPCPTSPIEIIVLDDDDSKSSSFCDLPPGTGSSTKISPQPTTHFKEVFDDKDSNSSCVDVSPRTKTATKNSHLPTCTKELLHTSSKSAIFYAKEELANVSSDSSTCDVKEGLVEDFPNSSTINIEESLKSENPNSSTINFNEESDDDSHALFSIREVQVLDEYIGSSPSSVEDLLEEMLEEVSSIEKPS